MNWLSWNAIFYRNFHKMNFSKNHKNEWKIWKNFCYQRKHFFFFFKNKLFFIQKLYLRVLSDFQIVRSENFFAREFKLLVHCNYYFFVSLQIFSTSSQASWFLLSLSEMKLKFASLLVIFLFSLIFSGFYHAIFWFWMEIGGKTLWKISNFPIYFVENFLIHDFQIFIYFLKFFNRLFDDFFYLKFGR